MSQQQRFSDDRSIPRKQPPREAVYGKVPNIYRFVVADRYAVDRLAKDRRRNVRHEPSAVEIRKAPGDYNLDTGLLTCLANRCQFDQFTIIGMTTRQFPRPGRSPMNQQDLRDQGWTRTENDRLHHNRVLRRRPRG